MCNKALASMDRCLDADFARNVARRNESSFLRGLEDGLERVGIQLLVYLDRVITVFLDPIYDLVGILRGRCHKQRVGGRTTIECWPRRDEARTQEPFRCNGLSHLQVLWTAGHIHH